MERKRFRVLREIRAFRDSDNKRIDFTQDAYGQKSTKLKINLHQNALFANFQHRRVLMKIKKILR